MDRARFDAGGGWSSPPDHWVENAEERLGAAALAPVIREALERMPPRQRAVVTLRDVDGLDSDEVCEVRSLSQANQRVLCTVGAACCARPSRTRSGGVSVRFLRHELVCQEVVELVTDYLEGALSSRDRRRFERHLAGCPHCTEYLAQMRETIRLTGRLVPADLSPRMQEDFGELLRRWREEDPGTGP